MANPTTKGNTMCLINIETYSIAVALFVATTIIAMIIAIFSAMAWTLIKEILGK